MSRLSSRFARLRPFSNPDPENDDQSGEETESTTIAGGGDIGIPLAALMHGCLQIKGKWMYEPADVRELIRLVETGIVKLGAVAGVKVTGKFGLADYEVALANAAETAGPDTQTAFIP
ncbi:hypothetical protein BR93DRAFT_941292 [Coniochaeta sp. PMI_546]|nr:hypothetical protein BR93DRAFT_941292 [Coniochaeta sp. PMI_546]